jgi:hypothetical protein
MKTAVEFLVQRLAKNGILHSLDIAKAKEMEKQQIIEAHGSKLKKSRGVTNYEYWYTGEDYYNDNFKNEKDGE